MTHDLQPSEAPQESPNLYTEAMIKCQANVIEGLELEEEVDYVEHGYNEECARIMKTNSDVRALLAENKLQVAADIMVPLLKSWAIRQGIRKAA